MRHSVLYPAIVALSVAVAGCGTDGKVADAPALSQANTAVQRLSHGTATVSKVFPGPGGLEGLVIHPAHPANLPAGAPKGQIGWITRDGKTLIMGTVIGANGKNYTERAMRAEGLLPKAISARMLARKAQRADGFVVGSKGLHPAKGPEIIAFVDPNCIFCHKFYEAAMPLVNMGKLRVRFVVVGFLKPGSVGKAEAILSAKDPATAMARNEARFNTQTEEGGIAPDTSPSAAITAAVRSNTALLASSGELATPTVLWRTGPHQWHLLHGVPGNWLETVLPTLKGGS